MSVRTERNGRVLTVIIDRPEVRNAVDGPTARALAATFHDFEADDAFDVAVLAGADLKAFARGDAANGNPLDAREALAIGLANRVVSQGQARAAAEQRGAEIARLPQTCLRSDRRSADEQWALAIDEALGNEFRLGMAALASGATSAGVSRFASGEGRHGAFDDTARRMQTAAGETGAPT